MIFSLARSPAKNTTHTVFSHFSPVVGSTTVPRICDCFKNMFPRVARNKIRSNEITLFVRITPVMNPSRTADAPAALLDDADAPSPPRPLEPAASNSAISKYDPDLDPISPRRSVAAPMPTLATGSKLSPPPSTSSYDRVPRKSTSPPPRPPPSARLSSNIPPAFSSTNCSSINSLCVLVSLS